MNKKESNGKRTREAPAARRKHRGLPALAAVITALAVVGAAAIVIWGIRLGVRLADRSAEYEKYENKIYPVVMFDPIAFENPAQLDNTVLLQMAMWSALLGENRDKYTYDDGQNLVVPASDLDVEIRKLFGDAVTLQHQTFGDYEYNYRYIAGSRTYSVPVGGQAIQYTPQVEEITSGEGDVIYLRVGYIPPKTLWNVNTTGEKEVQEPDKYMIYVLQKNGGSAVITAVRELGYGDEYTGTDLADGSQESGAQTE